jgi:hypothetical protein
MLPGSLTIAGTSASGSFTYNNPFAPACGVQTIPVTGTVAANALTLTSSTFAGSVATFNIQLPMTQNNVSQATASGTVQIVGGSCALASTTVQLAYVNFNTSWSGGASSSTATGTVSLAVTQQTTGTAGQFPATATLTYNSASCSLSVQTLSGTVSGYSLQLASANITVSANDLSSPASFSMAVASNLAGANCAGNYSGTITP